MAQAMKLTISIDEGGHMRLEGPIDNLYTCYALLELAKDALRDRAAQKARSPIEVVGAIGAINGREM